MKASDAGAGDYFGASLALTQDGSLMAVGAPGEDSKDSSANNDVITIDTVNYELDNGGVYIFARGTDKWSEQAKVKPSNNQWKQEFGTSVSLSADGTTLAVGTPGDWTKTGGINPTPGTIDPKELTAYGSGATYIFKKSGSAWSQEAYLKAEISTPGNKFGTAVSLSGNGNILAVGSWLESSQATGINGDQLDTAYTNAGAAFVFTRNGATWTQKSYVKAPNTDKEDRFGRTLKLDDSGDSLAVGAHRESSKTTGINGNQADNSADAAGAVYIY